MLFIGIRVNKNTLQHSIHSWEQNVSNCNKYVKDCLENSKNDESPYILVMTDEQWIRYIMSEVKDYYQSELEQLGYNLQEMRDQL